MDAQGNVLRYRGTAPTLKALAQGHGAATRVRTGTRTSRDNPTGAMAGHFLALRVRPAGRPPRPP